MNAEYDRDDGHYNPRILISQVKIRHKDVIYGKNQRPKPRTNKILSLIKSNSIYD